MDSIKINIDGARRVGLRFEEFPNELYDDLRREISVLAYELQARVAAAAPSRTGRLRGEVRSAVHADKDRITGEVYIAGEKRSQDFAKAGALEYGAHRRTEVNAKKPAHMGLDHIWNEMLAAPMTVLVEAYSRTPNIAEHAFERGPLAEMSVEILNRLNAVVAARVAETNK